MSKKSEKVSQKSAAEFFSEHQQIAGFDNPGKSLFTTIRELVENSLDAAESIQMLPEIEVALVEYTEQEHNRKNNIDVGRYTKGGDVEDTKTSASTAGKGSKGKAGSDGTKDLFYYLVTCKDNGCGIAPENIADMLGRVLSGSKHGVRQTRGKFGLGAKMALIWAKKSSGLPIRIRTAHSSNPSEAPSTVTTMVLDIDIYKNEPRVVSRRSEPNRDGWRGCEIAVTIAGTWGNYRSRVLQYFQQLAVITPYANLQLAFTCGRDDKKSFTASFNRRSEQMPAAASEILPHPRSLNNITLANLLKETPCSSLQKFLSADLSGVSAALAAKIANSLDLADSYPSSISSAKIAALCQVLRDEGSIKHPASACLSPAGEYNMRLGVLKELQPRLIATYTEKAGSYEGHPFIVEAAVSVGGEKLREGINVYRFANRIPLLFESGSDVVTQVALKRITWPSYHIDPRRDNVGVFVSIVSTRIPFKGTSKEYVGDDVKELQTAVKRALLGCCQQLRVSLAKTIARREEAERKKTLVKYIPDISRALLVVLNKMNASDQSRSRGAPKRKKVLADVASGSLSEAGLKNALNKAVDHFEMDTMLQVAAAAGQGEGGAKRSRLDLQPSAVPLLSSPTESRGGGWFAVEGGAGALIFVSGL